MRTDACSDIEVLLREMEQNIAGLHSQYRFLAGVDSALRSATRDKPFLVCNPSVWAMILGHRDTLAGDLGSLARSFFGENGYLGRLQGRAGTQFRRRRQRVADEPRYSGKMLDALHANAFTRMFPACTQKYAGASDFDGLASWYFNLSRPIMLVRRSSPPLTDRRLGRADALNLADIEAFINATEHMINDLRLVSLGTTVAFHEGLDLTACEAQSELVDMLLHGSLARAGRLVGDRSREAAYGALHRAHEQMPEDAGFAFNDQEVRLRLEQSERA